MDSGMIYKYAQKSIKSAHVAGFLKDSKAYEHGFFAIECWQWTNFPFSILKNVYFYPLNLNNTFNELIKLSEYFDIHSKRLEGDAQNLTLG